MKLTENMFRDVAIMLVNELKVVYGKQLVSLQGRRRSVGDVREKPRGATDQ